MQSPLKSNIAENNAWTKLTLVNSGEEDNTLPYNAYVDFMGYDSYVKITSPTTSSSWKDGNEILGGKGIFKTWTKFYSRLLPLFYLM